MIFLKPQTADSWLTSYGLEQCRQSVTFKKEPALSTQSVTRSNLRLSSQTNGVIPFAWDEPAGKLYLDVNRNLDLTDDGVVAVAAHRSSQQQGFINIPLTMTTPDGPRPLVIDVNFYRFSSGRTRDPHVQFALRTFWQGKLDWQGREWQVGLVENIGPHVRPGEPQYLLLRPWQARSNRIDVGAGSPDVALFARKLFWRGQALAVNAAFTARDGQPTFRLEFQEQTASLGEAKLAGRFVERLILRDPNGYTTVLDAPESSVKIPAGHYTIIGNRVKAGALIATDTSQRQVVVEAGKAVTLPVGGPLTNSVSVNRRGRHLEMNYRLVGVGGTDYRLDNQDRSKPPQFVVYQGDKRVASGKFEFG